MYEQQESCLQHVRDDTHTPHIRRKGNEIIVHNFRGKEFWGPKVHLQFLSGFVSEIEGTRWEGWTGQSTIKTTEHRKEAPSLRQN